MRRIIIALFNVMLVFTSCLQQMEEVESSQIAGMWALTDDCDVASEFIVFDKGYMYVYKSEKGYYVKDGTIWGAVTPAPQHRAKYKYSLIDGVLCYNDYYKDVQVALVRKGMEMMLGHQRCVLIENVNERYYSKILLSETSQTQFPDEGQSKVKWEYQIEYPIGDYELSVKSVPDWCSDFTIEDGEMSFSVKPGANTRVGNIVLSYPTAADAVIDVKRGLVEILVNNKDFYLRAGYGTCVVNYSILNGRAGVSPVVDTRDGWITTKTYGNGVLIDVDKNDTYYARYGEVVLSYDEVTVTVNVTQACSSEWSAGFWVGDWIMRGANGAAVSFRLSETASRNYICMTGYAGLSDEYRIAVRRYDETVWAMYNQIIGQVDLGNGKVGNLWMYGGNSTGFSVPEEGADICIWDTESRVYKNKSKVEFIALATECDGEWQCVDDVVCPTFPAVLCWDGD